MFKPKPSKKAEIDTLVGAKTRINGDVEFVGGFHLDGYINGNVRSELGNGSTLSVSEQGCIEGSVIVTHMVLNGLVKGDIEAGDRVELGPKARVLGSVHYTTIETAVGAQINGKLVHRAKAGPGLPDSAADGADASPKDSV
jgi:cytoskeletal protein CcmA (bactofilin family)